MSTDQLSEVQGGCRAPRPLRLDSAPRGWEAGSQGSAVGAARRGSRAKVLGIMALALVIFLVATAESCGNQGLPGASPGQQSTSSAAPAIPVATPTPKPAPIALSGTGSKVIDSVVLNAGSYRVSWTATGGSDNFIVHIHGANGADEGLVNEIPPNPSSGEAFFQAGGGLYVLEVKASTLSWTITFTRVG